jgi:hypothetical protein
MQQEGVICRLNGSDYRLSFMQMINFKVRRGDKFSPEGQSRQKYNLISKSLYYDKHFDVNDEMLMCRSEVPEPLEHLIGMNTHFQLRLRGKTYFITEACEAECRDTRLPLFPGCNVLHAIQKLVPSARQAELKSKNVFFSGVTRWTAIRTATMTVRKLSEIIRLIFRAALNSKARPTFPSAARAAALR